MSATYQRPQAAAPANGNKGGYSRPNYGGNTAQTPASASRPKTGGGDRPALPETTHTMKNKTSNEFVKGVFITENEFGLYVNVLGDIAPGKYYINKRKPKTEDIQG